MVVIRGNTADYRTAVSDNDNNNKETKQKKKPHQAVSFRSDVNNATQG